MVGESVVWLVDLLAILLIDLSVGQTVGWLIYCSISWLVGWSVDWVVCLSLGLLVVGWLVGWLISWFGCSVTWPVSWWSVGHLVTWSAVVGENLSQHRQPSAERLNRTRQSACRLPLTCFESDALRLAEGRLFSPSGGRLRLALPPRQLEQQVLELLAVVGVATAAVERRRVQWVGLRVEDVAAGAQDALAALAALLPGRRAQALAAVQEVGGVKEEVEVLDGLGEEERLHPVVQLVISHVFDLRTTQFLNFHL